jgi:hypothetical protein
MLIIRQLKFDGHDVYPQHLETLLYQPSLALPNAVWTRT